MYQKSPLNKLSAIVLAAGQSRRTTPKNKLLLTFGSKTVIQVVLDNAVRLNLSEILVVTGFEKDKIRKELKGYPVRFVHNPDFEKGMATSIKAGIIYSSPGSDGFMIFLGDMPWGDQAILGALIQSFYSKPQSAIVVPAFQERQGNPVIFAKMYKNELLALSGDSGARSVVERYHDQVIEVQVQNERLLFDIDTIEDYENLKRGDNHQ